MILAAVFKTDCSGHSRCLDNQIGYESIQVQTKTFTVVVNNRRHWSPKWCILGDWCSTWSCVPEPGQHWNGCYHWFHLLLAVGTLRHRNLAFVSHLRNAPGEGLQGILCKAWRGARRSRKGFLNTYLVYLFLWFLWSHSQLFLVVNYKLIN